jgi:hypothetical protein
MWMVDATPRPLYPREKPGTHCVGGWVGLRAGHRSESDGKLFDRLIVDGISPLLTTALQK